MRPVMSGLPANTPVVISFPVEEGTNQGSSWWQQKIPSLATQKIVARRRPVAPVVGLGPPTKG